MAPCPTNGRGRNRTSMIGSSIRRLDHVGHPPSWPGGIPGRVWTMIASSVVKDPLDLSGRGLQCCQSRPAASTTPGFAGWTHARRLQPVISSREAVRAAIPGQGLEPCSAASEAAWTLPEKIASDFRLGAGHTTPLHPCGCPSRRPEASGCPRGRGRRLESSIRVGNEKGRRVFTRRPSGARSDDRCSLTVWPGSFAEVRPGSPRVDAVTQVEPHRG